jgi:chromosome segregation ATPase
MREKAYHEDSLTKAESTVEKTEKDLEFAEAAKCPTCEQALHDDKHEHLVGKLKTNLTESRDYSDKLRSDLAKIQQAIDEIGDLGQVPDTYYDTIDEAYNHKGTLQDLKRQLEQTEKKEDTYAEQIAELESKAIQEVDYERANELEDLHRHQDFLVQVIDSQGLIHQDQDHRTELDLPEPEVGVLPGQGQTATHCHIPSGPKCAYRGTGQGTGLRQPEQR